MTYGELKDLVETMDEEYDAEYLKDKRVVVEVKDESGRYRYYDIGDWKFNQSANDGLDWLYLRCEGSGDTGDG